MHREQKEQGMENVCNGKMNREERRKDMFLNEENHAYVSFDARSVNESFARMVVMAFMKDMNPTLDELEDVKTAVSEAVTNAVIHGYGAEDCNVLNETEEENERNKLEKIDSLKNMNRQVELSCVRKGHTLWVSVVDHGIGISDIEEARQPFFTTKPEKERSGMGFVFMETFMDEIEIYSKVGEGTRVTMRKTIGTGGMEEDAGNANGQEMISDKRKKTLSEACGK